MDESDASITFDNRGFCDHCRTFYETTLPAWNLQKGNKKKLDVLSKKIKKAGIGKDFDCIIGMSGGIDSSYLTYLASKVMKLRVLVFHVDAGWNSQIAVNNIQRIVDGLKLDLYTEVINWEEMKDLQLSFLKSGVPHIDTPQDHAFFATMYKFATKFDIKYILTGANYSTECVRNPIEWMYYQSDRRQLEDIHKKFGSLKLKEFPRTSILWHKFFLPYFKGIKVEKPLNYFEYLKEDAVKLLIKKFDWQPYPQKHFESRFTRFYESYWLPKRFGYDTRKVQFSSLILTNQLTRKEALERLKKNPWEGEDINKELNFISNKLNIKTEELKNYLKIPLKTYKDYKSQKWIYFLGSRIMKFLKLEIGGKR